MDERDFAHFIKGAIHIGTGERYEPSGYPGAEGWYVPVEIYAVKKRFLAVERRPIYSGALWWRKKIGEDFHTWFTTKEAALRYLERSHQLSACEITDLLDRPGKLPFGSIGDSQK